MLAKNGGGKGQRIPSGREADVRREVQQYLHDLIPCRAVVERHADVQLQSLLAAASGQRSNSD